MKDKNNKNNPVNKFYFLTKVTKINYFLLTHFDDLIFHALRRF